ncbi:MAG: carbamoyltransferase HypF, partial [Ilumatobacteraceae bacterium]
AAALAHGFHGAVAALVVDRAAAARAESGLDVVALTGGTFQNVLLTTLAREGLEAAGFEVLTHEVVPPNDGGLALGQAVVAGTRTA